MKKTYSKIILFVLILLSRGKNAFAFEVMGGEAPPPRYYFMLHSYNVLKAIILWPLIAIIISSVRLIITHVFVKRNLRRFKIIIISHGLAILTLIFSYLALDEYKQEIYKTSGFGEIILGSNPLTLFLILAALLFISLVVTLSIAIKYIRRNRNH